MILRCQGFTEPVVRDIEAVRDELVDDLHETKRTVAMANHFDRLREAAEIENFYEVQKRSPRVAQKPE